MRYSASMSLQIVGFYLPVDTEGVTYIHNDEITEWLYGIMYVPYKIIENLALSINNYTITKSVTSVPNIHGHISFWMLLIDFCIYTQAIRLDTELDIHFHFSKSDRIKYDIPDWIGLDVNENLTDALLLNSTSIGHGYAVAKDPVVLESIKKNDIALEINPISGQASILSLIL